MLAEAVILGAVAQVSLLLAGLVATWVTVPTRVIGAMAGFGAGAILSAATFDLTDQAEALGGLELSVWLLVGALVFVVGDALVERMFAGSGELGRRDGHRRRIGRGRHPGVADLRHRHRRRRRPSASASSPPSSSRTCRRRWRHRPTSCGPAGPEVASP